MGEVQGAKQDVEEILRLRPDLTQSYQNRVRVYGARRPAGCFRQDHCIESPRYILPPKLSYE